MTDPRHILLFATTTGYQTKMFLDAAKRLGVQFTLATDRCHQLDDPWGDNAIAVRFEDPIGSLHSIAQRGPFQAVGALADRTTLLAALYAERAFLAFHPSHAIEAARSKFLSKERFRAAGLRLPPFWRYRLDSDAQQAAVQVPYPCVLKPLGLSGSRGVIRADNPVEFQGAFRRIRDLLSEPDIRRLAEDQKDFLQVEGFIPGREYALEGIVTNGTLQVLAIFDKPDPLDGPYFEETIYVTPSRESPAIQAAIIQTVEQAIRALGFSHGPVHAEVRHNAAGAWILEVAGRPIGGYCAKALRFDNGMPLEELLLRHALGEDVTGLQREAAASGVMMIPIPKAGIYRGVEGVEAARQVAGIDDVLISATIGQTLKTYPEASSYLGFIFARAAQPGEVEAALRSAHQQLSFEIMTTLT
ncbi:MAG TPA: ATP-grasp domain-containing protein [Bryobacteraceae bacterium]|nr:ATP-grasp domain-containing protein [Bryobacteraceae bacterium]